MSADLMAVWMAQTSAARLAQSLAVSWVELLVDHLAAQKVALRDCHSAALMAEQTVALLEPYLVARKAVLTAHSWAERWVAQMVETMAICLADQKAASWAAKMVA